MYTPFFTYHIRALFEQERRLTEEEANTAQEEFFRGFRDRNEANASRSNAEISEMLTRMTDASANQNRV